MIHCNIGINEFLLRNSSDKGDLLPTVKAPAIRDTKVKRFVKFPISENLAIPYALIERQIIDIHFYSNKIYRNFESDLKNINIFLEMSDTTKDNYSSDFDQVLPYDLLSRPYYVDSIVFNLDRSPSSDFDSE